MRSTSPPTGSWPSQELLQDSHWIATPLDASIVTLADQFGQERYVSALNNVRSPADQALLERWASQIYLLKAGVSPSAIDRDPCGFVR